MPGRYNKVLLRKGLARHAARHEAPETPDPKRVRARARTSAEEQMLLGDLTPAPEPGKSQRLEK
jgi:hypothetical protein